jgi:molybdopterin/thiamine biosynthesis adenylyltransferase
VTLHLADWVLRAIEAGIAAHPPERGGALLGPRGRPFVTRFEADPDAAATSTSWRPSRALAARVKALERDGGLELKGLVHSHPRGLDRASDQDARELGTMLRANGHLAALCAPIVTPGPAGELAPHELAIAGGKLSFHVAWRAPDPTAAAEVEPVAARVVPLAGDLERVAREHGGTGTVEPFEADAGAGPVAGVRAALGGGEELLLLASEAYPALPPLALLARPAGGAAQLAIPWPLEVAAPERLARALGRALSEALADAGGAGRAPRPPVSREALFARSAGLLSPALSRRRVLLAGCGSVGSYVAEQLARSGVGAFTLLDPEEVDPANLARSAYEAADAGSPKVEALARRLARVAPGVAAGGHAERVDALEPAALDALVRAADLVVGATDDPAAQRALNRFAWARGRPALYVGLYAGAQGGEVVVAVPERTACYLCATRARHAAPPGVARALDYGTGRLAGEVALGADVQHVASAAVKLALSLLVAGEEDAALAAFAERAVAGGTTYLTMSTVPDYWFYPEVFGDAPGQGAYQSVWLAPARAEDCPVCGAPAERVDPLEVPLRAPSRDAFRNAR